MSVWNKKQARRSISGKGFPLRSSGPEADSTPWIIWVLFSCIAYDYRILFLNKLLLKLVHGLDMLDQYHHQIPPQCATYGVKKKLCCCCNWNLHSRRPDVDDGRPAVKKSSILFFWWGVACGLFGLWINAPQEPAVIWEDFCSRCRDIFNFYLYEIFTFWWKFGKAGGKCSIIGLECYYCLWCLRGASPYQQTMADSMNLWSDWRHDDDDLISKQWTCQVNSYMLITWGYQDTIKEVPSQWFVCQFGIRSKQEAVISGKGFPLRSSGPGADSTPWIIWVLFSCIAYDLPYIIPE